MKKVCLVWSALIWLCIGPFAHAETLLMHIDEIRPGMKGIGKTVFAGTTIEEFDVEVLAVLKNETPQGDTIMARISGGSLPIEKVGVVGGMSGSPIYIDGKLIGALAYTTIFGQEPMIAGITPIHEMLADASRSASGQQMASTPLLKPSDSSVSLSSYGQIVPIKTPLVVSGIDSRALSAMQEQLSPFHIVPVQGGSASQIIMENPPELQPGAAIGVQLIRGDMNASTIGTVTYRDQDKIIAFGHPMFWAGDVNLPMTSAYVHFVWSNQIMPSKIASPLESVGTITQDRRTGISGFLGPTPSMVPLTVNVRSQGEQMIEKQYEFEVMEHPLFTSMFMSIAGLNSILASESITGKATVQTRTTIALRGYPPIILENVMTGNQDLIAPVLSALAPINFLLNNSFTPTSLEKVTMEVSIEPVIRAAEIIGLRIEDNVVRPGEDVEVAVSLRLYGEDTITITEQITIPENLHQEQIQLLACDVKFTNLLEAARATGKFQPQNLDQLIALLNEQVGPNHLVLSLLQLRPGFVVQGQELPSPPLSMMTLMGSTKRQTGKTSLTRGQILLREHIPTQYVLSGCTMLELFVDHNGDPMHDGMSNNENSN